MKNVHTEQNIIKMYTWHESLKSFLLEKYSEFLFKNINKLTPDIYTPQNIYLNDKYRLMQLS